MHVLRFAGKASPARASRSRAQVRRAGRVLLLALGCRSQSPATPA